MKFLEQTKRVWGIRHVRWVIMTSKFWTWWHVLGSRYWLVPNPKDLDYLQKVREGIEP